MNSQPFRLDGKTALVTGGASGIGEQVARASTKAGAAVIICDMNGEKAATLAKELPGARAIACDITNEEAVVAAFGAIEHLDILINNAGIGLVGNVAETELADFQRIFRV
jgi:2-keto-3-deoxy-L-fuconate dehydrogenase